MKITIKIIAVNVVYEGTSRTSGLPCQSLEVIGEKPGMRTQRVVFKVFDNSEGFSKLKRFDLRLVLSKQYLTPSALMSMRANGIIRLMRGTWCPRMSHC